MVTAFGFSCPVGVPPKAQAVCITYLFFGATLVLLGFHLEVTRGLLWPSTLLHQRFTLPIGNHLSFIGMMNIAEDFVPLIMMTPPSCSRFPFFLRMTSFHQPSVKDGCLRSLTIAQTFLSWIFPIRVFLSESVAVGPVLTQSLRI